ncbi:MAG: hypothetical protein OXD46_16790 [Chloroflexi bacterium]|nr:hypothetical protein [Chloroflexota bacterium]
MYTYEDHMMHDAWYFVDDENDAVHMFHLAEPLEGGPSFVGHAISRDLVTWERLPTALRTGPPGSWDDLRICTGSVIERDGQYWMAYSATSLNDSTHEEQHRVQRAGMAVSDDLITWAKLPENPVTEAVAPHYERMGTGQRKMHHWRDPFLFEEGDAVYQLVCARRNEGPTGARGTVALARSVDMQVWEVLPPLEHDRISDEMEVPQLYRIGECWYLVFCTLGRFLTPEHAERFGGGLPERSNFSMVAGSPFGPFRVHGTGQIVEHDPDAVFYAAQLVEFNGSWYLLATIKDEQGERISDPVPVYADNTGIHAVTSSSDPPGPC